MSFVKFFTSKPYRDHIIFGDPLVDADTDRDAKVIVPPKKHQLIANIGSNTDTSQQVDIDVAKAPHIIIAGQSGYGKGVLLQHFIASLLENEQNTNFRLVICDRKGGLDYSILEADDRVRSEYSPGRILNLFRGIWRIHEYRTKAIKSNMKKNIAGFNQVSTLKMKPIIVVIDEYAVLMSKDDTGDAIDKYVSDIMAICRATGIHIVLTTQRPTADVVSGDKKNNADLKISFKVNGKTSSNVVGFENDLENHQRPHTLEEIGVCLIKDKYGVQKARVPYKGNDDDNDEWIKRRLGIE